MDKILYKEKYTYDTLFEEFLEIEEKFNLYNIQLNNVYLWKIIRFDLFREIAQKLNLISEPHPSLNTSKVKRLCLLFKRFCIGSLNNPLRDNKKFNIMLFSHERKISIDNQLLDIYSYNYEKKWTKRKVDFAVIETPYNNKYARLNKSNIYRNEILSFRMIFQFLKMVKIDLSEFEIIKQKIGTIGGINVRDISILQPKILLKNIRSHLLHYNYYKKVLNQHKPKEIYLVVSYGRQALIHAAKELNIKTIEIQHGTITATHPGYSFNTNCKIPYFPDEINLWGKFWDDTSSLPKNILSKNYVGFDFLHKEVIKYKNNIRNDKRVLFISQGVISNELIQIAIECANKTDLDIIYRLHPSESKNWKKLYPKLFNETKLLNNLFVEESKSLPLYHSFSISNFVVGVSSTALIESLALKCKLILINLPSVEYYKMLYTNYKIPILDDSDSLVKYLMFSSTKYNIDSSYFFLND